MSPATAAAGLRLAMQLIDLAATGVPRAVAAVSTMRAIVAEGRDPTPGEWTALQQVSDSLHARIQAAAREDDGA